MGSENALGGSKEKERPVRERRASLKVGSVCAAFGTLAYAAFGILHGSTSGRGGAEILFEHVLERPYWDLINLGSMLAILCWLAAFVALARSLGSGTSGGGSETSAMIGRLAVVSLTFGAAVASLQFFVDGYTLTALADRWATASPADQEGIVRTGDLVHTLIREPVFASEPIFLFGLPFALIGLGITLDQNYPAWFGWAGFAVGAATFVMGVTWFAGFDFIPELALWVALQPLEWLWLLVLGAVMWRRSSVMWETESG